MPKYKTYLKDRVEIARDTMAFFFEKPEGFNFKAGQTIDLTLIGPPETDAEGNTRTFSIANTPEEERLMIATRLRDTAFKRTLKNAALGLELEVEGPMGSFTLHNDASKPAAFLTGGIGITPAHSIIGDATKRRLPHKLFLFYSNRTPEDAPFLEEFLKLADDNPNFVYVPTMTKLDRSETKWFGETGYIDEKMLERSISDLKAPIYYLTGPASMVMAMREMLNKAGVDDDYIRTEEFSGY